MKTMCKLIRFIASVGLCCLLLTVSKAQNNKRYFTGDNTGEKELNTISRSVERATRDMANLPSAASLKQYAPLPGDQGKHGTCVAWSTAYAGRTISYCVQRRITDQAKIKSFAFSPGYLYYYIKQQGDNNCSAGANIENALKVLSNKGNLLLSENIPDCVTAMDNTTDNKAKFYAIKDYTRLTESYGSIKETEITAIKKSLSEKKPVLLSLKCMSSFFNVGATGAWITKPTDVNQGGHAMCIVGYDDNKLGGAFEVMNSWGTNWGNKGFFWLTYPQMLQYANYAVEMMDREAAEQPEIKGSMDFVLLEGASMPVVRSKITTRSITVEDDEKADYSSYRLTENYPGGTAFKIKFTTNAPAFVYIFSVDDKNVVSKLFPYTESISPAINSSDATVFLPSEKKHARLSNEPGSEKICVLYSKTQLDFNGLINSITKAPSKMYETIMATYKEQLIPVKDVRFSNDSIGFSAKAGDEQMLCFFIDLNHK